jgi:uncharacterized peroxidase-related enzyme
VAYIQTVPEDQSQGLLRDIYDKTVAAQGYLPNHTKALSLRPEAIGAWHRLRAAIQTPIDLRRYELVTLATAQALRCTYCMLAHGSVLRSEVFSDEQLEAIARDFTAAGLPPAEVAMMAYAQKIALHAYKVVPEDIDVLRSHGFSDGEILDIALTAALRCFFSKVLDAVGADPDAEYSRLPASLIDSLAIGRPFRSS